MALRDIMTRHLITISAGTSLDAATCQMREHDIGALPVVEEGRLVGIVTDRDIATRGFETSEEPTRRTVGEVMTGNVVTCFEDETVEDAIRLMERKQIRRILVVNRDGGLVGIVSLGDIAVDVHDPKLTGEALADVSRKTAAHGISFDGILVPLDGSRLAEEILPYVITLNSALNARVTLLRVIGPFETLPLARSITSDAIVAAVPTGPGAAVAHARTVEDAAHYLERTQKQLAAKGMTVDIECQEGPSSEAEGPRAAHTIVERATHLGVGLIAMTSHGRSGFRRALFGSVTDVVLREAPCPVMVVKAHQPKAE